MGGIYYQIVRVTDFGPYVTKLVLAMPRAVANEELNVNQFNVYVEIKDKFGDIVQVPKSFIERDEFFPSKGYREISGVYSCDKAGQPVSGASRFVAIEMKYGPIYKCSSTSSADFKNINGHEFFTVCDYLVSQVAPVGSGDKDILTGLVFDHCAGVSIPQKERFREKNSEDESKRLRYGYFVPQIREGKRPLIIWLHGAGEGGQETAIAYAGNKATELTEDWVQEKFNGAFVLVPQCPTMWLDDGSGEYGDSGKSKYVEILKNTIDDFISMYAESIDINRIYVGGDSNGGFMTMRMLIDYPDFFAAAFPICEALIDESISDEEIDRIKDKPIWFTHAKNDPIVVPDKYVVPTYKRLMAAGAKDVHFTFWDKLVDRHEFNDKYEGFLDENGNPFEYLGHFAWIPMLNDDCKVDFDGKPVVYDGREVTLLDWLAVH